MIRILKHIGYNDQPLTGYQQKKLDAQMEQLRIEVGEVIDVYADNTSKDFVGSIDRYAKNRTERALEDAFLVKPTIYTSERLKGLLEGAIKQNVNLIRGLADDVLKNINTIVHEATVNGNGVEDIYNNLQTQHKMVERRAKLIAYDQTRKITSQVGNQRARDAGAEEFEWVHSGKDANPRRLHQSLHGKIFRYDDPPVIQESPRIKGLPSQLINCKCQAIPVFRLEKEEPRKDIQREYKKRTETTRAMRTDYYGMTKQEQAKVQGIAEEMYDKYKLQVESIQKVKELGPNVGGIYLGSKNRIVLPERSFKNSMTEQEKADTIQEKKKRVRELRKELKRYNEESFLSGISKDFKEFMKKGIESNIEKHKEAIKTLQNKPTKEMKARRGTVGTELKDILVHEYGHALENNSNSPYQSGTMYHLAKRKGDFSKISKYSEENNLELLAEAFTAYTRGEKIPKYMRDTIEEMITRNKKR